MKTVEMTVTVGPDRELTVRLPPDVHPGRLRLVMVIEEVPPAEKPPVLQVSALPGC